MLFGTLIPPIFDGTAGKLLQTTTGQVVLGGILLCGFGIALCGLAGRRRELELSSSSRRREAKEFSLATWFVRCRSGRRIERMLQLRTDAGKPIAEISVAHGTDPLYSNNVVLIAVLTGGFLSNALCCLAMNLKNRTLADYVRLDRTLPAERTSRLAQRRHVVLPVLLLRHGPNEARQAV